MPAERLESFRATAVMSCQGLSVPKHKNGMQRGHFTGNRLPTRLTAFRGPRQNRPSVSRWQPSLFAYRDGWIVPPYLLADMAGEAWWRTIKRIAVIRCCKILILKSDVRSSDVPNPELRGGEE